MWFWSQNAPQNGSQNHPKSVKNQSRTVSGLKNVIFSKIAPRLGETLIFEGPGSPKPSQNQPKMLQEPIKNPTKISIEFWMDFVVILASFWLPKSFQNDSKSDSKNVPKNRPKNHWKMMQKWAPKLMTDMTGGPSFWAIFMVCFFLGAKGLPKTQH